MKLFSGTFDVPATKRSEEHGGVGDIQFRRLLIDEDFSAPVDFVDFTIIPPGSTIGLHQHSGNEEIYLVVSGSPLLLVDGQERRMVKGALSVVHSGQSHGLKNDTDKDVEIFVIQVRLSKADVEIIP